jgi:hypothetical protein
MFQVLDRLDSRLRARLEKVATVASQSGDRGVVEWTARATQDALALGRLRDRDVAALERLEDTYSHDFYRNRGNPAYA